MEYKHHYQSFLYGIKKNCDTNTRWFLSCQ
jgi:hypothetical protein